MTGTRSVRLLATFMILLAGCSVDTLSYSLFGTWDGSFDNDEWAVIEHGATIGTQIHEGDEPYFFISGSPYWKTLHWAKVGSRPVQWILKRYDDPSADAMDSDWWPNILSADVSCDGQLVLARSNGKNKENSGTTEVYDFATGRPIQVWRNSPLGVRWSNSGKYLAIARQDGPTEVGKPVLLTIRDAKQRLREWRTEFAAKDGGPRMLVNQALYVSWSADDKYVAVSTKSAPQSALKPFCVVFPADGGEPLSIEATNASFVSGNELVANLDSDWDQVALIRIKDKKLERVRGIEGRYLVGGSNSVTGTYYAWLPPNNNPAAQFTLKLALFDSPGGQLDESWGYNVNSTLQLIRRDTLKNMIGKVSTQNTTSTASFVGSIH